VTGYNYHAPISLTTLCPTLHYLYNLVVVVLRVVFSVLVVIESAAVVSYCLLKSIIIRLIRCIDFREGVWYSKTPQTPPNKEGPPSWIVVKP
jgi:hypothetical protein